MEDNKILQGSGPVLFNRATKLKLRAMYKNHKISYFNQSKFDPESIENRSKIDPKIDPKSNKNRSKSGSGARWPKDANMEPPKAQTE